MSSNSFPTILLITGAFTTTQCYDRMVPLLEQAGYPTAVAAPASCASTDIYGHTAASDGNGLLEEQLLPLINEGKDVVVFAHSFGATCLSGADRQLSKAERASQGLKGGVVGLAYISFALAKDGASQIEYLGGTWPPFCKLHYVRSFSRKCQLEVADGFAAVEASLPLRTSDRSPFQRR